MKSRLALSDAHRRSWIQVRWVAPWLLLTAACAVQAQTGAAAAAPAPAAASAPLDARQKMSYAVGVQTVRSLHRNEVAVDIEMLIRGIRDAAAGERTLVSERELKVAVSSMQAEIQRKLASDRVGLANRNRQRGEAFSAEYAKRPGVQMLPSRVLMRELRPGTTSQRPREDSVVKVSYRGVLLDGSEFDASEAQQTATMEVAQLIPGWREALKHMSVGSRHEIVVPPHMGYGERGVGAMVGPNETLIFTVELHEIVR